MAVQTKIRPKLDFSAKFSGNPGECPDSFLKQFNTVISVAGWTDVEIIQYFPLYLAGSAASWWSTVPLPTDWQTVQRLLLKTFASPTDLEFPELKLHARKYDPLRESIHTYYFSKLELCNKVDPNMLGQLKKSHILKDLPAEWGCQMMLASSDIKIENLLPILQGFDDQQRKILPAPAGGISLQQIREVIAGEFEKRASSAAARTFSTEFTAGALEDHSHPQEQPQQRQPSVICQICDRSGHSAAQCYKRFTDLNVTQQRGRGGQNNFRGQQHPSRGSYYGQYQNQAPYFSSYNGGQAQGQNFGFTRGGTYFRNGRFSGPDNFSAPGLFQQPNQPHYYPNNGRGNYQNYRSGNAN